MTDHTELSLTLTAKVHGIIHVVLLFYGCKTIINLSKWCCLQSLLSFIMALTTEALPDH